MNESTDIIEALAPDVVKRAVTVDATKDTGLAPVFATMRYRLQQTRDYLIHEVATADSIYHARKCDEALMAFEEWRARK